MFKILQYPHSSLRRISKPVVEFNDQLINTIHELIDTMVHHHGQGLASNQVDLDARIFVITTSDGELRYFINPKIIKRSLEIVVSPEGCLSIPDCTIPVVRHFGVEVEAFTGNREPFTEQFVNADAITIQHEYDHLDGILITDKPPIMSILGKSMSLMGSMQ